MRISDWSSDVCSSDLAGVAGQGAGFAVPGEHRCPLARGRVAIPAALREGPGFPAAAARACAPARAASFPDHWKVVERAAVVPSVQAEQRRRHRKRSEEHTSELQSLMRISYAVFCLKKKTNTKPSTPHPHIVHT